MKNENNTENNTDKAIAKIYQIAEKTGLRVLIFCPEMFDGSKAEDFCDEDKQRLCAIILNRIEDALCEEMNDAIWTLQQRKNTK